MSHGAWDIYVPLGVKGFVDFVENGNFVRKYSAISVLVEN